jgi:hypothetical protein
LTWGADDEEAREIYSAAMIDEIERDVAVCPRR